MTAVQNSRASLSCPIQLVGDGESTLCYAEACPQKSCPRSSLDFGPHHALRRSSTALCRHTAHCNNWKVNHQPQDSTVNQSCRADSGEQSVASWNPPSTTRLLGQSYMRLSLVRENDAAGGNVQRAGQVRTQAQESMEFVMSSSGQTRRRLVFDAGAENYRQRTDPQASLDRTQHSFWTLHKKTDQSVRILERRTGGHSRSKGRSPCCQAPRLRMKKVLVVILCGSKMAMWLGLSSAADEIAGMTSTVNVRV